MSSPSAEPAWASAFTPDLSDVVSLIAAAGENPTIVIDGPSGAGKSTVADALLSLWPRANSPAARVQLVRLDDIYPGWEGLEAAATIAQHILSERSRGRSASWQRYDWARGELTTWHEVDPSRPLIVEGCGSLSAQAVAGAQVRIWVSVSEDVRKERALARGGEDFESHWEAWDQQFMARILRDNPERFANMILAASE